ncbi:MAG: spore coat protein CotH [Clostridiaceae bacterium]|nr:spore coat protein CotH [Clostridiaceae bacterium]
MSGSKHFDKIAWTFTVLILLLTVLFMNQGVALGVEVTPRAIGYENSLFDNTRVHTIDIVMNNWDEFIADAVDEEYYVTNLVIDGEAFKNAGIRGKGNTSLSSVAAKNSERYSFKIEFDRYDSSLTYYGLDKLNLNNLIHDTTMMKDYLSYTMMKEFGVNTPLCSFVYITVNGEDWGLYLAVEGIEEAFLERNYGSNYGELYKPDSMNFGGGRGNGRGFKMNDFLNRDEDAENPDMSDIPNIPDIPDISDVPDMSDIPDNPDMSDIPDISEQGITIPPMSEMPRMPDLQDMQDMPDLQDLQDMPRMPMPNIQDMPNISDLPEMKNEFMPDRENMQNKKGGFAQGIGSSDIKLQYIDDNIDSYLNIWDNAKTDIVKADQTRLIESLKKLTNGETIDSVVDIDQVIRYFVVHNYVCNGDSYTGAMVHNYYLYEQDGQMAMIPWDYNLAFGTFQSGNAQSTVNTPIDSPVSGASSADRPMWNWIVANEEYTELYHQYFTEFLNSVDILSCINDTYDLIKSYVEKDPTAFYEYNEFETGVETLRQFCTLRTESISAQLANNQTSANMNYVDASGLTLSEMGSMGMVGSMQDIPREKGSFFEGTAPEGFDPSQNEEIPEIPDDFDFSQMSEMPDSFDPSQIKASTSGLLWLIASALILCVGIIIVKVYKH